jgi:UDP-2,3-diacylglucosamine pyrophosphatase LpxH
MNEPTQRLHPIEYTENGRVATIRTSVSREQDQWFLLTADWHWDNPKCDRQLLEKHLKQAKERNAGVLVFGDTFCLMQGRYDGRRVKGDIRPEHNNATYLDSVVDTFTEWIEPYNANMTMVTYGNHETSIIKNIETDVLQRVSARTKIPLGKYDGWLRFIVQPKTANDGRAGTANSVNLYYHHGSGGGGVVTKGVIQTNRRNAYIDGADIIVSGHVHEAWILETPKEEITHKGSIKRKIVTHVQTGTYKEEFTGMGWHVERGAPPKPLGSWWMRIYYDFKNKHEERFRYEFIRTEQ